MASGTTVRLELSSDVRLIDLVHAAAEKVGRLAGLEEEQSLDMALAVREAVINAVLHGHKRQADRRVEIDLEAADGEMVVRVVDRGDGFEADTLPDPTDLEHRMNTSGRGLLLMRAFTDEMAFSVPEGGGTEVRMVKRRDAGESSVE